MTDRAGHGVGVWASPTWREDAVAWIDEHLARAGRRRTGPIGQPHLRPWATALRVPVEGGAVWMKATAPGTAFEAGIYGLMHRVAPEGATLRPIATAPDRGWMLLEDGGPTLAQLYTEGEQAERMGRAFGAYGRLQLALAPHADELLALGVADMRPAALPARFDEALRVASDRVPGEAPGAARRPGRLARLEALRPAVARWSEELAAAPGGASIDHNDLHPGNVFASDPPRFFDWGDSVVAHPFSSMLVGLDFVRTEILDTPVDDPRVTRLRDAYLEPFAHLAPHAELVRTVELARRLGLIARTLVWHRALAAMADHEVPAGWEHAPYETLTSLLDPPYAEGG